MLLPALPLALGAEALPLLGPLPLILSLPLLIARLLAVLRLLLVAVLRALLLPVFFARLLAVGRLLGLRRGALVVAALILRHVLRARIISTRTLIVPAVARLLLFARLSRRARLPVGTSLALRTTVVRLLAAGWWLLGLPRRRRRIDPQGLPRRMSDVGPLGAIVGGDRAIFERGARARAEPLRHELRRAAKHA